jgi:exodeoxyribonuclease VII large subunit
MHLPASLVVRGQISGWKRHQRGHCYFSLKDEDSVLPCVMWSSSFSRVRFKPEDGMAVLATGSVGVWTVGGRYQFYAEKLEPEGKGALQLAFEQMVKKLEAEGLFADAHKQPIPTYPERIGILTSESGAAVHDIADSVHNRWPCTRLFLYPVPVQGEGAAGQIAAAVRDVNRRNVRLKLDLLIVGRGGGSLEDLWAFNEEVVARAVYESRIPIISAVGHEVDVTIADLVADRRASTPTKAGVVAVPDMREVLSDLAHQESRLSRSVRGLVELYRGSVQTIEASAAFRNPLLPVRTREQQVDELTWTLADATRGLFDEAREQLHLYHEQVARIEPHRLLGRWAVTLGELQGRSTVALGALLTAAGAELDRLSGRTEVAFTAVMNARRMELTAQANHLAGLNPKSVLKRGYSITTKRKTGQVVKTADDVRPDDLLVTELGDENLIESRVTDKVQKGD